MKRNTGVGLAYLMLALVATLPVLAYDFHSWRSDGTYTRNTSRGQQSSHQAFNLYDQGTDAQSGTYALYWQGELQHAGGTYPVTTDPDDAAFGRVGPDGPLTADIADNRQQDREPDWVTWPPVLGKMLPSPLPAQPVRPVFTPGVPQAWSPVVYDLDDGSGTADHLLIAPSFEPDQLTGTSSKEQVLNVYYPETAAGLPGNSTALTVADRGASRPLWIRGTANLPGVRIRDLEPVRNSLNANIPGVGVITQPPIFARVPATYKKGDDIIFNETLPVVFLVVGTGEAGDHAKVICFAMRKPAGMADTVPNWAPTPQNQGAANVVNRIDITTIPNFTDYFNPNDASGGAVMWSYTVRLRADKMMGSNEPTPVAGISFADIGTANAPRPRLFITTADGQIICLNAKAADQSSFDEDGDAAISAPNQPEADDPEEEWVYELPIHNIPPPNPPGAPAVDGLPANPLFYYGMAPAVARVPLTNLFTGNTAQNTVTNALTKHNVSEWQLFVADAYGMFYSFEAPGRPNFDAMNVLQDRDGLLRWINAPFTPPTTTPPPTFRVDEQGNAERFITPPVVYQGATPLTNDSGSIVNGSSDIGYDDEVIFSSEKGSVYALDAIGRFTIGGANDGQPLGITDVRWTFPDNDTALTPPQAGTASDEPRAWPRDVPDDTVNPGATWNVNDPAANNRYLGPPLIAGAADYGRYFSRGALAVSLGANANPNGLNPNLEAGDDNIYVPYLYEITGTTTLRDGRSYTVPAGSRAFYEYIGSLKPYPFIQASRPIEKLTRARVVGGGGFEIPLNRIRVGIVKGNGLPVNQVPDIIGSSSQNGPNPNYEPSAPAPEDTVYFVATTWYEDGIGYRTIPFNATIELEYDTLPGNGGSATVTEQLPFMSCFRLFTPDPNAPQTTTVVRGRASFTEGNVRLEQYRFRLQNPPPNINDHEGPALVNDVLFTTYGYRQPSMFAAGSSSSNGTLLAPSWFRGRIIALSHRLRTLRVILGSYDVRLDPNIQMQFSVGPPEPNYGPKFETAPDDRDFTYDPGVWFGGFYDDESRISDVGASVTIVDGWTYVAHRNGHVRAYANVGGGAGTTFGNPPYLELDKIQPATGGNLVHAPAADPTALTDLTNPRPRGIHFTSDPTRPYDPSLFLDRAPGATPDSPLLIEWGDTLNVVVDFGAANELAPANSVDGNKTWTDMTQNDDIDGQVLQNEVQAQIRSPNGAIQQLPGQARGVRPQVYTDPGNPDNSRICAVIQVFTGVPSITNPLTPGTPLLWEKDSTTNPSAWTGEVTYEIQVAQQGLRWRWPPYAVTDPNATPPTYQTDTAREHYWETERSVNNVRFPTTSGFAAPNDPRWDWFSEWAPLLSYNNPIMLGYDPAASGPNAGYEGLVGPGVVNSTVGWVDRYTDRNAPGRKNGDAYTTPSVDGARSGSGQPVVPTVGMGIVPGSTPVATQLLFASHGTTSPVSTTFFPDLAKLRVGDRSKLALNGRALMLRVQPAPLTKMGVGALYGRANNPNGGAAALANLPGAPQGSFEQNTGAWDDSPTGHYSSIPSSRLMVTKQGTNVDLTQSPMQVAGRNNSSLSPGGLPTFNSLAPPMMGTAPNPMEQLAVQVDVPRYTADDVYSTRWRSAGPNGANPLPVSAGGSQFNPFFPGSMATPIGNQAGRPLRDRAERLSRPGGQGPQPAPNEDPGGVLPAFDPNPNMDDRLRRVVVFNDANNNGQLDLTPTFREAYRTFAVQVMVKPEMKIEARQQLVDLGNLWHGKKQPGIQIAGNLAAEIREWQMLQALSASPNQTDRSKAQFYSQYWRPFTLVNTGNVNLAYVKPEVAFQIAGMGQPQLIALPSEANDPWKALRLINGTVGTPNPLIDPFQIFLRTSFDDQLLPTGTAPYGAGTRGVWLQKAQPGAAQGGAVAFADPTPETVGGEPAAERDPFNVNPAQRGQARETYISLNIPTGTPLGEYGGSLRFYNDRTVSFQEDLTVPGGFRYVVPQNTAQFSGTLERDPAPASQGEPLEPVTDPPLRLKTKVIENLVHGRHQTEASPQDQDRRFMPAASPDASAVTNGSVSRLLLAYVSNRLGVAAGQQTVYDLFATALAIDPNRGLFPFDELPRERIPWRDLANSAFGWTNVTASGPAMQQLKPSLVQDPNGQAVIAWTQRQSTGQGNDQYALFYQPFTQPAPIQIQPGGTPPDPRIPRQGIRMVPASLSTGDYWLAVYSRGQGLNRNISYTFTTAANLNNGTSWASERPLATPKGLASVTDPHLFTTPVMQRAAAVANQPTYAPGEATALPEMAWMSFTGSHLQLARTDIYLSRYRIPSLVQAGSRTNPDLVDRLQDFARVGFPRTENDVLRGNPERTRYVSSGGDFIVNQNNLVELKLGRPDLPPATAGSTANPLRLIGNQIGTETTNGEIVFPLLPATIAAAPAANQARLAQVRVYVDKNAGVFRLSHNARTVAGLLTSAAPLPATAPDPVLTGDFTAATIRITKGDVPANDSVVIPTLSDPGPGGIKVMDASWYRQQIDTGKWASGTPVAGIADRLWVLWRRSAGANSGGATCFYKVLRPGIRVNAGAIYGIRPNELSVNGGAVIPEEVNAQTGQLFFPQTFEGQQLTVTYLGPTGVQITEQHYVNWQDETGEIPVPMDTSVNEGSLDGFASYEDVGMTPLGTNPSPPPAVRHVEKIWLFWSSTRNSGGDLMYATLAPRIGPEANVGNTATFYANSAFRFTGMSANAVRSAMAAAAAEERRRPFVVPPMYRRGPYVPRAGKGAARRSTR